MQHGAGEGGEGIGSHHLFIDVPCQTVHNRGQHSKANASPVAPDLTSVFQTGEEEGTDHRGHTNELGDGGLEETDEDQATAHQDGSGDGSRELDREEAEVVGEDQIQGAAQEQPQAGG